MTKLSGFWMLWLSYGPINTLRYLAQRNLTDPHLSLYANSNYKQSSLVKVIFKDLISLGDVEMLL